MDSFRNGFIAGFGVSTVCLTIVATLIYPTTQIENYKQKTMQINTMSAQYQTAYYQATKKAALTGDRVFEVSIAAGRTTFLTGKELRQMLVLQQNIKASLIKNAVEIV